MPAFPWRGIRATGNIRTTVRISCRRCSGSTKQKLCKALLYELEQRGAPSTNPQKLPTKAHGTAVAPRGFLLARNSSPRSSLECPTPKSLECPTAECSWSAQPQNFPGVPDPKSPGVPDPGVPSPESPGVPNPRVSPECPAPEAP